jgi:hypothetical protein
MSSNGLKANLICQTLGRIGSDDAISILYAQLSSEDLERRKFAAFAIAEADPQDLCGYYDEIKSNITDRLALVRIESARKAAQKSE